MIDYFHCTQTQWLAGKTYKQRFERGAKASELEEAGEAINTGTIITFKPDHQIFPETTFDLVYRDFCFPW